MVNSQSLKFIFKHFPWVIFLVAFLVRLILFFKAEVIDSDAVSRVFIAEVWLLSPTWISNGIWGPFHTYLNALPIYFFNERVISPVFVHSLIGSLIVIPVYRFSERLFNINTGIVASLIIAFSPVVVRSSLQPMAEVPHAFFIATGMLFLLNGFQNEDKRIKWFLLSGLCMTIASGFRYEAWLLIALFSLVIVLNGKWKSILWFWVPSMIFPSIWMLGNYLEFGNIIYGADYATYYNTVVHGVNDNLNIIELYKRILFFPLSLFHIYPLPLLGLLIPLLIFQIIKNKLSRFQLIWLIPFVVLMCVFVYKASGGTLLLQHRFSILLLILIIPFSVVLIPKHNLKIFFSVFIVIVVSHLIVSGKLKKQRLIEKLVPESNLRTAISEMRWDTFSELQSRPTLSDNITAELLQATKKYRKKNMPLILDFIGWETTYNFALKSGVAAENIVFLSPDVLHAEQGFTQLGRFKDYPTNSEYGLLLFKENSGHFNKLIKENGKLNMSYNGSLIPLEELSSLGSVFLYKFNTKILKDTENEFK